MTKPKVLIIVGSVREERVGEGIAKWVKKVADSHSAGMEYEMVDLKGHGFGNYTDARPASLIEEGQYATPGINKWAEKVDKADGYILVTPEYNHSYPGSLKNALDAVYTPWNKKPVSYVSYGSGAGGARAVEHLRGIAAELQQADIRLATHIVNFFLGNLNEAGEPKDPTYTKNLQDQLDQLEWWVKALKSAREAKAQ